MDLLTEQSISCPYCGESLDVLIEPQDIEQEYIEDCQVCCRPITFVIQLDASDHIQVGVHDENDTY